MAVPNGRGVALFKLQKYIVALLFLSFLCGMILGISLVTDSDFTGGLFNSYRSKRSKEQIRQSASSHNKVHDTETNGEKHKQSVFLDALKANHDTLVSKKEKMDNSIEFNVLPKPKVEFPKSNSTNDLKKPKREDSDKIDDSHMELVHGETYPKPNYNVHIFYYPWYGNPETDGQYLHWNHEYLQHWDKKEAKKWPRGRHQPPNDVGSNFYPQLGPYSSRNLETMEDHMKQIRLAGVGVLVVSWYPPDQADEQGKPWDVFMPSLLDVANKYNIKVCFHIEPFQNRNAHTMLKNIKYIHNKYGQHPAYYRYKYKGRLLPVFYIYDSYLVKADEWGAIFRPDGRKTVRNTAYDAVFLGLVVNERHKSEVLSAGFDGFYTYFASDGFSYGSSTRNWVSLAQYAKTKDAIFVPSVGPGYIDERVRPWNAANTKGREHGGYYEQSFKAALAAKPPIISITSFNEWGEGTQIEKAVPKQHNNFKYSDYSPQSADYYLTLTRKWIHKFKRQQQL